MADIDDVAASLRRSRDDALATLQVAINRVEHEIATTNQVGPYLKRLADRDDALINEAAAVREATTDAVLVLPEMEQAAATLVNVAQQMQKIGKRLPTATDVLTTSAAALSLGQKFVDVIVNARK